MKKKISTFLVVVMVVMVCSTATFATWDETYTFKCTGDGVDVRIGQSAYSDSLWYLYKDETLISRAMSDDYGSVRYGTCPMSTRISKAYGYQVTGYVSKDYLLEF